MAKDAGAQQRGRHVGGIDLRKVLLRELAEGRLRVCRGRRVRIEQAHGGRVAKVEEPPLGVAVPVPAEALDLSADLLEARLGMPV